MLSDEGSGFIPKLEWRDENSYPGIPGYSHLREGRYSAPFQNQVSLAMIMCCILKKKKRAGVGVGAVVRTHSGTPAPMLEFRASIPGLL